MQLSSVEIPKSYVRGGPYLSHFSVRTDLFSRRSFYHWLAQINMFRYCCSRRSITEAVIVSELMTDPTYRPEVRRSCSQKVNVLIGFESTEFFCRLVSTIFDNAAEFIAKPDGIFWRLDGFRWFREWKSWAWYGHCWELIVFFYRNTFRDINMDCFLGFVWFVFEKIWW